MIMRSLPAEITILKGSFVAVRGGQNWDQFHSERSQKSGIGVSH